MKDNSKIISVIIVLCLLLVGLGGYIIYDKFISKPKTEENNDSDNAENRQLRNDYPYKLESKENIQIIGAENTRVTINTDGTVDVRVDCYIYQIYVGLEEKVRANCNNLMVNEDSLIRLDIDKVVYGYYVETGNSLEEAYFVFLKEDGSLSTLSMGGILFEGKIITKNIAELKWIVNVYISLPEEVFASPEAVAVDMYGKEYVLTLYL